MSFDRIPVSIPERPYDIVLGSNILGSLAALVDAYCPAHRYVIIADETVASRYGDVVMRAFEPPADVTLFTFPPGEWNKTRQEWIRLTDLMLESGVGRDAAVVALGGGVSGDLAGFVAATYCRGLPLVQIPTTLLAMIDSSIGGKTGVDTRHGKNLVGAFHQPHLVLADVDFLKTLPPNQLASGVAEALKHGVIADEGYFEQIVRDAEAVCNREAATLIALVRRSVEIKADVVAEDERETGRRAVLNFGHTVAHAVEARSGFEFLHGEAVAVGMVAEARVATALGLTGPELEERIRSAAAAYDLPTDLPNLLPADLIESMQLDKKNRAGDLRLSLPERVGSMARAESGDWTFPVPLDVMRSVLGSTS